MTPMLPGSPQSARPELVEGRLSRRAKTMRGCDRRGARGVRFGMVAPALLALAACGTANRGVDVAHAPLVTPGPDGRYTASVPGCPDWSRPLQPDFAASTTSDYGCATRSNLAAMIADPRDLIQPAADGTTDPFVASKAIRTWRDMRATAQRQGVEELGLERDAQTRNKGAGK